MVTYWRNDIQCLGVQIPESHNETRPRKLDYGQILQKLELTTLRPEEEVT